MVLCCSPARPGEFLPFSPVGEGGSARSAETVEGACRIAVIAKLEQLSSVAFGDTFSLRGEGKSAIRFAS
jgi:hypothetical protein